ncbi:amino acid ABC transporter permease [Vibrio cholerae]|uniref:amino acid ABC transporter permease n=1 Tax=Vibrio cholerae TaxID=666 RepID=UPI0011EF8342|nr:amino acid ABC transporter permease [Vibrio cholerae]EGR2466667.1 amino acid ABC transporter permease [Vibrio cholerae]ELY5178365.1 amino acid ABC transporter permease [Vibrio cholerae]TYW47157.1 amino acid ABC transporter permease [Vibrio cholerae]TYW52819.1 amino acid ABC transporter permease [Vibrio cholerae]
MNNYGAKSSSGYRFTLLDGGLLLAIASLIGWLYYRSEVGIHYQWHWREAWMLIFTPRADGSLPYFLQGLGATLRLSLWGMVLALVLGSLIGIARSQKAWFVRLPANAFVQLVRNIPPLVFVFIFYFFISNQLIPLLGLDELLRDHTAEVHPLITWLFGPTRLWENLLSGVLCIGLLSSAYIAEIVRAGLVNIPQGQWEAADSLGLPTWVKYRYVIAPQVLTAITPALAGQTISLIKDTSIISLISIQELTFVGSEIANSSGLIFEIWLIVGAAYLVLCLSLSMLFKQVERRSLRHLSR